MVTQHLVLKLMREAQVGSVTNGGGHASDSSDGRSLSHRPLLASLLFDLVALRWRGEEFRATSLSLLALGVPAALVALLTGHLAEEAVEHSGTIPKQAIETHEELAFVVFGCLPACWV